MGGADKLRAKRKKKVNTGCSLMLHINRAFSGGGVKVSAVTVHQASEETGSSTDPVPVLCQCRYPRQKLFGLGSGCNFRPIENYSSWFWMCSGHTELGSPPIGSDNILHFEQFVRSALSFNSPTWSMTSLSCWLFLQTLPLHRLQMACVLSVSFTAKKFHCTDMFVC